LYPSGRSDIGKSRAIDEDTAAGIINLRKELPDISLVLLKKEAVKRRIILPGEKVAYPTFYRLLKAKGLADKPSFPVEDRRRFEAENPNDLWQSDIMHGPYIMADEKLRKTYLVGFIDDMSRLSPYAQFYLHERLDNFLSALRLAFSTRGIPRKLYVDNGPAFRSHHLEHICASLGVVLIHARPYQPEGKGKIERWFRTVRESFLPLLPKNISLSDLNGYFKKWLAQYHETVHSITGQSPLQRFTRNIACLRPSPADMEDHFRKTARRTVNKDRTVSINGKLYEAPVDLIGKQIILLYHEHDPSRVEAKLGGKTFGFIPELDVNVNSRIKRLTRESSDLGGKTTQPDNIGGLTYNGGELFSRREGGK
jgi:transposase InsO family protein